MLFLVFLGDFLHKFGNSDGVSGMYDVRVFEIVEDDKMNLIMTGPVITLPPKLKYGSNGGAIRV